MKSNSVIYTSKSLQVQKDESRFIQLSTMENWLVLSYPWQNLMLHVKSYQCASTSEHCTPLYTNHNFLLQNVNPFMNWTYCKFISWFGRYSKVSSKKMSKLWNSYALTEIDKRGLKFICYISKNGVTEHYLPSRFTDTKLNISFLNRLEGPTIYHPSLTWNDMGFNTFMSVELWRTAL